VDIVRARDCRTMAWKNGGGSTTEIATGPPGASLEAFDWRISMARVASDGPFSAFAGIERTLAVVTGRGLVLTIGDRAPVTLAAESPPVSFDGDMPTSARLLAGEITDLNVMTRRERFRHRLTQIERPTRCDFADRDDLAVVIALNGGATIASDGETAKLDHGDAAILARARDSGFLVTPGSGSDCYLILLSEQQRP
jgi:environmental stress-induced protein Ves